MQEPQNHEDLLMLALETAAHKISSFISNLNEELIVAKNDAFFESPEIKKKRQNQEFFDALHKSFVLEMIHIEMTIKYNLEKRFEELLQKEAQIKNEYAQKTKEERYLDELYLEEKNQSQRALHQQAENLKAYVNLLENHIKEIKQILAEIQELKIKLKADIEVQMDKLIYQYNAAHVGVSEIKEITLPPIDNSSQERNTFKFDVLDIHHKLREIIPEKLHSGEINANEIKNAERNIINHFFEDKLLKHYQTINPSDTQEKKNLWVKTTMATPRFTSVIEGVAKQVHSPNPTIAMEAAKLTAMQQNLKVMENVAQNCEADLNSTQLKLQSVSKEEITPSKNEKIKNTQSTWRLRIKNTVNEADANRLAVQESKPSNIVKHKIQSNRNPG